LKYRLLLKPTAYRQIKGLDFSYRRNHALRVPPGCEERCLATGFGWGIGGFCTRSMTRFVKSRCIESGIDGRPTADLW